MEHRGLTAAEVAQRIRAGQVNRTPRSHLRDYAQIFDEVDPTERRTAVEIIGAARDSASRKFAPGSHNSDPITEVA